MNFFEEYYANFPAFDHSKVGISDFVHSLPNVYSTELKDKLSYRRKGSGVVANAPMGITSNADWWLTSLCTHQGNDYILRTDGEFPYYQVMSVGGMLSKIYLNPEMTLVTHVDCYSPTIYSMMVTKYGHAIADQLSKWTYRLQTYFGEEAESKLTSISAYAEKWEVQPGYNILANYSFLNRSPWADSMLLSNTHGVVWNICSSNTVATTNLRIRNITTFDGGIITTVFGQKYDSEATMDIQTFDTSTSHQDAEFYLNIAYSDEVDRAFYDNVTNTVTINPFHQINKAFVEIWPTDTVNKTESDHSPIVSL
jgi:hypothetical protein